MVTTFGKSINNNNNNNNNNKVRIQEPKTELSTAKVYHFQLLPFATKTSRCDTINSVQKSWNMSSTLSPKVAYVLSVLPQ